MHGLDQRGDMIERRGWKNSMAKVENVARPIPHAVKDLLDISLDQIHRAKKNHGIEVPLDSDIIPRRAQASPIFTRQSTPITSPPARFISSKSVELEWRNE